MKRMPILAPIMALVLLAGGLAVSAQSTEPVDLDAVYKIKDEGFARSEVMDIAWWLTEVHGPRLTNSPQLRAAADWAAEKLSDWGLANVALEPWGEFGRGWSNERTVLHVLEPTPLARDRLLEGLGARHRWSGDGGRGPGAAERRGGSREVQGPARGQGRACCVPCSACRRSSRRRRPGSRTSSSRT